MTTVSTVAANLVIGQYGRDGISLTNRDYLAIGIAEIAGLNGA